MSAFERLTEDYATRPVPVAKTVSGLRIGLVLGGIGIALPALLSGSRIGAALGLERAIAAFMVAGLVVSAMGAISAYVGTRSRLSTYMIIQFSFGPVGSKLVNIAFAVSQIGWFTVNVYIFGTAAEELGREGLGLAFGRDAYVLFGGALMTVSTIFGFKALDRIALFAVPLLLATLVVMIVRSLGMATVTELFAVEGAGDMRMITAITALAGGIMVGVVLLPDLTRYARSARDGFIAIVIALAIVEPLVHLASAMPAVATGQTDVLRILLAIGFGGYALLVLIVTSWTTNAVNLYGCGLSMSAVVPQVREWRVIALSGTVATAVALLDVSEYFINFLVYQSITFAPVVGIYVADFFAIHDRSYRIEGLELIPAIGWPAFGAWATGSFISFLAERESISLTTIPAIDGAVSAGFLYLAVHLALRQRLRVKIPEKRI